MASLSELYGAAQNAPDAPQYDNSPKLGPEELPEKTQLLVEVTMSKAGTTNKGAPKWSNIVKIVEGGPVDGELWASISLSPGGDTNKDSYNKACFAKLEAAGIEGATVRASSPEAIAQMLKGKRFKLVVGWETDKNGKVWDRHQWMPLKGADVPGGTAGFTPKGF